MSVTTDTSIDGARIRDEVNWFLTAGHPMRGEIRNDPYPFYDRLRDFAPVFRTEDGVVVITSYEHCYDALRDEIWDRERRYEGVNLRLAQEVFFRNLAFRDAPDHDRLRRVVAPVFTPGAVARRRERVREIVRELLEPLRKRDEFDFYHDLASLVPVAVIGELLGIPAAAYDDFVRWTGLMVHASEPIPHTEAELQAADDAAAECLDFFNEHIEARRDNPRDDMLTMLFGVENEEDPRMTHDEVIVMCVILHLGGHDTTSNLIANGQLLLMQHPDARRDLQADLSLVPSAVEEILRYDSPPRNAIYRIAPRDLEIGGVQIYDGDLVYAVLGAADRDPAAFEDPNRFDIRRDPNRHLAFGLGARFCLGAHLARLEIQEVFHVLSEERVELDYDPDGLVWRDSFISRALEGLPVRWA